MATGTKTYNAGLGVDIDENNVENLSERAHDLGKSAGVVSSVPFSHATPAAYSAHNTSRNNYIAIADEQAYGEMDVVMGAGHPMYDDDHQQLAVPKYTYIGEEAYSSLKNGGTGFTLVEENADLSKLTAGETPDRVFGISQVGSTLQQGRSLGAGYNDVVDLPTMTRGALNVLDNNENGFHLMVEGGAIDWAGHANSTERDLEEVRDFNESVEAVIEWVETNSNWDETLVIVTANHETGYIGGVTPNEFNSMKLAGTGMSPEMSWNSFDHTRQLVGMWAKGRGAAEIFAMTEGTDPIRGSYIDNTAVVVTAAGASLSAVRRRAA